MCTVIPLFIGTKLTSLPTCCLNVNYVLVQPVNSETTTLYKQNCLPCRSKHRCSHEDQCTYDIINTTGLDYIFYDVCKELVYLCGTLTCQLKNKTDNGRTNVSVCTSGEITATADNLFRVTRFGENPFTSGILQGVLYYSTISGSFRVGKFLTSNLTTIGSGSFATGERTEASGNNSAAFGINSTAYIAGSVAHGTLDSGVNKGDLQYLRFNTVSDVNGYLVIDSSGNVPYLPDDNRNWMAYITVDIITQTGNVSKYAFRVKRTGVSGSYVYDLSEALELHLTSAVIVQLDPLVPAVVSGFTLRVAEGVSPITYPRAAGTFHITMLTV